MGGEVAKQWQMLAGRTVAEHSVAAFRRALPAIRIVVVVPPGNSAASALFPGCLCVEGGDQRAASVRAGLEALATDPPDLVLIHDAARPMVGAGVIARVVAALDSAPGAAPGLAVSDALWRGTDGRVTGTADRTGLWRAQTPQGFTFPAILAAHRAHPGGAADDVAVALAAGIAVALVEGDDANLKLTTPADMARAEKMMEPGMDMRVGQGFDVHAFGPGDQVTLCGVSIGYGRGLVGHSDADVGLHAVCDAVYGALSEGDIGRHFPPSEARWKGADSMTFLAHAGRLARDRGYRVSQIDVTLICEAPKIAPMPQRCRRQWRRSCWRRRTASRSRRPRLSGWALPAAAKASRRWPWRRWCGRDAADRLDVRRRSAAARSGHLGITGGAAAGLGNRGSWRSLGPGGGVLVVIGLGWWATTAELRRSAETDPSWIVVDEVAGQWLALLPVVFGAAMNAMPYLRLWPGWLAALLLFRLFDIWKPGPVGWADRQHGAFGVMLDDLIAGGLAALGVIVMAGVAHGILMR